MGFAHCVRGSIASISVVLNDGPSPKLTPFLHRFPTKSVSEQWLACSVRSRAYLEADYLGNRVVQPSDGLGHIPPSPPGCISEGVLLFLIPAQTVELSFMVTKLSSPGLDRVASKMSF